MAENLITVTVGADVDASIDRIRGQLGDISAGLKGDSVKVGVSIDKTSINVASLSKDITKATGGLKSQIKVKPTVDISQLKSAITAYEYLSKLTAQSKSTAKTTLGIDTSQISTATSEIKDLVAAEQEAKFTSEMTIATNYSQVESATATVSTLSNNISKAKSNSYLTLNINSSQADMATAEITKLIDAESEAKVVSNIPINIETPGVYSATSAVNDFTEAEHSAATVGVLNSQVYTTVATTAEKAASSKQKVANEAQRAAEAEQKEAIANEKVAISLNKAEAALNKFKSDLTKSGVSGEQFKTQITSAETALSTLRTGLESGSISASEAKGKISLLTEQIKKLSSELGLIKSEGGGLSSVGNELKNVGSGAKEAATSTSTLYDKISSFQRHVSTFTSIYFAVQQVVSIFERMASVIEEVDSQMAQLKIVTNANDSQLNSYASTIAGVADNTAGSIADLVESTTTYARLGYDLDQSTTLSELTAKLQNVGDIDVSSAQSAITAIVKAYDVKAEDLERVMDELVEVGNNFPISVSELAEGMNNAGSMLSSSDNSLEESFALLTSANTTVQNISKSSTGLRTIAARLRKMKTELDDLGEAYTEADYDAIVQALTGHNVSLTNENGELRSTYDVLQDIAHIWDSLSSKEQAGLAEKIAGTRQQNIFYSIIENFQEAEDAIDSMNNAEGTLEKKNSVYTDTVAAHIQRLQNAWTSFLNTTENQNFIKDLTEIAIQLVKVLQIISQAIDDLGGLKVVLSTIGSLVARSITNKIVSTLSNANSGIKSLNASLNSTSSSLKSAASSQGAFNTAMTTGATTAQRLGNAISTALGVFGLVSMVIGAISSLFDNSDDVEDLSTRYEDTSSSIESIESAYESYKAVLADQSSTVSEVSSARESLIESLGTERQEVIDLIEQYGNLEDAYDALTSQELSEKAEELFDEANDSDSSLVSQATAFGKKKLNFDALFNDKAALSGINGGKVYYSGYYVKSAEEAQAMVDTFKEIGLEASNIDNQLFLSFDVDNSDANSIKEYYYNLENAMKVLSAYGWENSDMYNALEQQANRYAEAVENTDQYTNEALKTQIEASKISVENSTDIQNSLDDIVDKYGDTDKAVSKSESAFEKFKNKLIETVEANEDVSNSFSTEEIEAEIDAILSCDEAYAQFYETQTEAASSTEFTDLLQSVSDAAQSATDSVTALDEALEADDYDTGYDKRIESYAKMKEMAEAGEFGSKHYQAYVDYFMPEDIQNSDTESQMAWIEQNAQYFEDSETAINNWLNTIRELQDTSLNGIASLTTDESGNEYFWYDVDKLDDFADVLGWTTDEVEDFINKTRMYIPDFMSVDANDSIEALKADGAIKDIGDAMVINTGQIKTWCEAYDMSDEEIQSLIADLEDLSGKKAIIDIDLDKDSAIQEAYDNLENEQQRLEELGLADLGYDDAFDESAFSKHIFGNIDMDKREIIEWTDELKQTYSDALSSWDYEPEVGSIDTVYGASSRFGEDVIEQGVEVAFTPIMKDSSGQTQFLDQGTVYEYINDLVGEATENGVFSEDKLLDLDAAGKQIGDTFVKGIIASADESMDYDFSDGDGNQAAIDAMLMHFSGDFGAISLGMDELEKAASSAGTTVEEVLSSMSSGEASTNAVNAASNIKSIADQLLNAGANASEIGPIIASSLNNLDTDYATQILSQLNIGSAAIANEINANLSEELSANVSFDANTGEFTAKADSVDAEIERLSENTASPEVKLEGADTVNLNLSGIETHMNALNGKTATTYVKEVTLKQDSSDSAYAAHQATGSPSVVGGPTLLGDEFSASGKPKPELVVHNGEAYLAGQNGPEIKDLSPGDQVYNYSQTKRLFGGSNKFSGSIPALAGGHLTPPTASSVAEDATNTIGETISSAAEEAADETDTLLENFKDWISKLFDWMEIKLDRLDRKINNYESKADTYKESQNYNKSASNYVKAIAASATKASYEESGAALYKKQANNILNTAVSSGLISDETAKNIKSDVASGKVEISEYSERVQEVVKEYQNWFEKSLDCKDAISDLHESIREYIDDLKDLRQAQRDATTELNETYNTIGTSGITNSSGWNTKLANSQLGYENSVINSDNAAYSNYVSSVSSDSKRVGRNATNSINKELFLKNGRRANISKAIPKSVKDYKKKRKAYRAALRQARACVKSKKAVPSSVLKVIKTYSNWIYQKLYAYNLSLDNIEDAKLEAATEYATNSATKFENIATKYSNKDTATENLQSLYRQRADNATTVTSANNQLAKLASTYDDILSNDDAEILQYKNAVKSNKNTIKQNALVSSNANYKALNSKAKDAVKNNIKKARDAAKSGKPISASLLAKLAKYVSKGYIKESFYEACVDYNNALESKEEAEAQKKIDVETAKQEKEALGTEMISNIEDKYQRKLDRNSNATEKIQIAQDLKTTKGYSLSAGDYTDLIEQSKAEQQIYNDEISAIQEQIRTNLATKYWDENSEGYKEALINLESYKNKAAECAVSQEEWNNSILNIPFDNIEKALDYIDAIADEIESEVDLKSAQGLDLSKYDYDIQMKENSKKIDEYTEQAELAEDYWKKALASGGAYAGKTAQEWKEQMLEAETSINNLKADNEALKDALRDDVYWREFERAHDAAQRLEDVLEGINSLISDDMLFDSTGKFTSLGIAKVATLAKEWETLGTEAKNYQNDIENLYSLYAGGQYTEEEFKEKLAEFQSGLLDTASSMQSVLLSIADMYKNQDQEELDALNELIDARKEALQTKKDYYDYDKTIKDKTKDIQTLQAQIAALEGVETAEARAKKAQLEAELAEQQEDLDDTVQEHIYDLSQDALDSLEETLQDAFDDKWDSVLGNMDQLIALLTTAQAMSSESSSAITSSLSQLLSYFGINSGIDTSYASGTKHVPVNQTALTNEEGAEIIVTKDGLITPLPAGSGVVPADLTSRLYEMATTGYDELISRYTNAYKGLDVSGGFGNITLQFDKLINIEGSADAATVKDLENMSQALLDKSYQYISQKIYTGYMRSGGKRTV